MLRQVGRAALVAAVVLGAAAPLRAQGLSENFDNVGALPSAGWVMVNRSQPPGESGWFQGATTVFTSQGGAANSYIGANFLNTGPGGTISNWLLTPVLTLANGATLTFYTRTRTATVYPDRLEVRMSTQGASTHVGDGALGVGDFTSLLLSVNPTLAPGGYPQSWTQQTATVSGLGGPVQGRLAFRYFVTGSGPGSVNGDYVGIDTVASNLPPAVALSVNDVTVVEGNAGVANAVFTVSLSGASTLPVTVSYATANGTATAPGDYTAASGSLTFAAGTVTRQVGVPVVGDQATEADETFTLNLGAPAGATIADAQGLGRIVNDDVPSLSVNDVTLAEGEGGVANAVFTVSLSEASPLPVTVSYATADGTATTPADYGGVSGSLTFAAGTLTRSVNVPVVGDEVTEPDETFTLNLSAPAGATVQDAAGVGTIVNDDVPTLSVDDVTVAEGDGGPVNAAFRVNLYPAALGPVSVSYGAADGTATGGQDFGPVAGTLVFPAGTTQRTVLVPVLGDRIREPAETFEVVLSGATGAPVGDGQGQGTIMDDDAAGLSITDVVVRERIAPDAAVARFLVRLSPPGPEAVTVKWATEDGTATATEGDYDGSFGELSFPAGADTQPVDVVVNADTLLEGVETFVVTLSEPTGAPIAAGTGTARILDPPAGGDFNGDGSADLLWRHEASGENVLWYMDGPDMIGGTLTTPPSLPDVRWQVAGTNDFNADAQPDILWRHAASGENVVWYMDGPVLQSGTFLTPSSLADVRWGMVGTGDFNLDGQPDILWRHSQSGELVTWLMNGSVLQAGTFLTPPSFDVSWQAAGTGDFNSDGKVDILWRHTLSGQVVVWFLDGTSLTNGAFTDPPALADPDWRVVATEDYDRDGKVDIVWRHAGSGQNVIWFMDGLSLNSGTFTDPSLPDTTWRIVGPR